MFLNGRTKKLKKLGMCYFADENLDGGGAGGNNDQNQGGSATDSKGGEEKKDAKFTQDDLNRLLSERLAEAKTKHEKELADLKAKHEREAELAKMSEKDRLDAQYKDLQEKYQQEKDKNELAVQTEETRKLLEEAKLPTAFLKFVQVPKDSKQTQLNINELKTVFDSEVKKGVEAQIKPHKPNGNTNTTNGNEQPKHSGPSYSGLNLQNSIDAYYNNQK